MDEKIINKKGQVAIWVILGIILAVSVILYFLIVPGSKIILPGETDATFDAQSFVEACTRPYVNEVIDLMLPQGGLVNPSNSVIFNNKKVEYLCLNRGNFAPCVHQRPLLINEMKLEIRKYLLPKVDACFQQMATQFEKRVGDVNYEAPLDIVVNFEEDEVILVIDRETTISSQGETRKNDKFVVNVQSPIYNLGKIAMEISDQEAKYCYFEYVGYNILYPRYEINPYTISDQSRIYTIKDLKFGKEMNIAIRSCAIGPGGDIAK